ncbi:hypothetical protein [Mesorhizobium sp. BHbdii]
MKSQEILANTTRLGPVHLRVVDIPAASSIPGDPRLWVVLASD